MNDLPERITLEQWGARYRRLCAAGLREPPYGGCLRRHAEDGDLRLHHLRMDNSPAALRLWNFLLTEEDRLRAAQDAGKKLIGALKDLGTVPVIAYAFDNLVTFYPDGAWWIPCIMQHTAPVLEIADRLGIDDSFCPVRALLGAFVSGAHFPIPERLISSVGATCDDMTAIVGRLEELGHRVFWWEMPHRRRPDDEEAAVELPGGVFRAPANQVAFVREELERVRRELESYAGRRLSDDALRTSIRQANRVRELLATIRHAVFMAERTPLPALEMLIAEMLAIHFCSDPPECILVLEALRDEIGRRRRAGLGVLPGEMQGQRPVRVFWVNPVADLRVMNLLEDVGGRICGTEYLFSHALDPIPEDDPPIEALARSALADPMVGSPLDRAERVCRDMQWFEAEALVVSRIPGASHCATEGLILGRVVQERLGLPVVEIEVPPVVDTTAPTIRTRLEALIETVKMGRHR